jgi:hypothetical protein
MKTLSISAIDAQLDAWVERHWPLLSVTGYTFGFALLFGSVALHAFQSRFALALQTRCGATCFAIPGFPAIAALLFGVAAVLFVWLFTRAALAIPGPTKPLPPLWAAVLHCLIGCVVFLAMLALVTPHTGGRVHLSLHGRGALELFLGWWIGGLVVLKFFWRKYRASF